MRTMLALAIAKTLGVLSRLAGRGQGQALPGLVAERIDPQLGRKLAARLPQGVILVTGTNGKTTTTKLLAAMLEAGGERVLTNRTGSNLRRGIMSALIAAADGRGYVHGYTLGVFEVDEASMRQVAPELQPRHIVVLNLFRDQLDRYGELDTTAAVIGQAIAGTQAELHLNADDPLVASLGCYVASSEKVHFFGIEGLPVAAGLAHYKTAGDSERCPICNASLIFSRVFYAHIGHYRCLKGHFNRPQPVVAVTSVRERTSAGSEFTLTIGGKRDDVRLGLPGTYNIYNALAALSVVHATGLPVFELAKVLIKVAPAFGRFEQIEFKGRRLFLLLIKNPAGFTQVLETFLFSSRKPVVLMAINDLPADGRDVSWLWDVPLEALAELEPRVVTTGIRAADMSLRLQYAGVPSEEVENFGDALEKITDLSSVGDAIYVLPTYTAMVGIRKVLSKLVQIPEMGE